MEYRMKREDAFAIISQEIELSEHRHQNMILTKKFWRHFNKQLALSHLAQAHSWQKYAFMRRIDGKLQYACAIPYKDILPLHFQYKEIPPHTYMVVKHIGAMDMIYETYDKIYRILLPQSEYIKDTTDFLHFERYDHRFQWNVSNSIIEIWVPVKLKNTIGIE